MSTLEKKALAFEKLAAISDDNSIAEILLYIENINKKAQSKFLKLADEIIKERNVVLEKLAQ